MDNRASDIHQKIDQLPSDLRHEVEDFIDFVQEKRTKRGDSSPRFDWAGALDHLKEDYTSVELQHKILETRGQ